MEQKLVVELLLDAQSVLGENDKGIDLAIGDKVVLYVDDSYSIASVVSGEKMIEKTDRRVYRIIRKVSAQDLQRLDENKARAAEACKFVEQKILEHDLSMRVVSVQYSFDRSRLSVYYTSDGHVDFRGLVRDLAQRFQTRIHMEQIGPRDETRLMGGIGVCGLVLCCHRWLPKLESISVGMAKVQQLSLNIPKLSGPCNKLKCCLSFEHEFYKECARRMPNPGSRVKCADGEGKVLSLDCIKNMVTVAVSRGEAGNVVKTYSIDEVQQIQNAERQKQQQQKQPQKQQTERDRRPDKDGSRDKSGADRRNDQRQTPKPVNAQQHEGRAIAAQDRRQSPQHQTRIQQRPASESSQTRPECRQQQNPAQPPAGSVTRPEPIVSHQQEQRIPSQTGRPGQSGQSVRQPTESPDSGGETIVNTETRNDVSRIEKNAPGQPEATPPSSYKQ